MPGGIFVILFWSFSKKISSKNSVLAISEILSLFVKILTPDDKYSLSGKAITNATNSNVNISKSKNICWIFCCISGIKTKFEVVFKKRWASEVISFWNYRLEKAGLLKCLKGPVSEHLWTVNILKGHKDCLHVHGSIFVRFFHHSERKSAWKSLS